MDDNVEVDVVVVGGGLSGLSAAHRIMQKDSGLRVLVLEAKDRVGGRTLTVDLKSASGGTDRWDLGGQWVGNNKTQPHVMSLIQELGLEVYRQHAEGIKYQQLGDNKVRSYKSDIPALSWCSLIDLHLFMQKMETLTKKVSVEDPGRCTNASEWDSITLEQAKQRYMYLNGKGPSDALDAASRCMFGVECSQMSLLYYLSYARAAGSLEALIGSSENSGQEFKIKGGAQQLSIRLAESLGHKNIWLQTPVVSISQTDSGVTVRTAGGKAVSCQRVIIATPPHQAAKIHYEPALPTEKAHVFDRMPVGNLIKIIVTYEKAFWREAGASGEVVTNGGQSVVAGCDTGPLCIVFDATSGYGSPAIVGFIGGDQAIQYNKISKEERKRAVLHSLSEFFGQGALDCVDYAEKDWREEAYSGGCPVSVGTPGMMTHIAAGLRQPFKWLHFAGTESATVWCGFMNGAIQSGIRAANEVLYNLRPQAISAADLEGTAYGSPRRPITRTASDHGYSFLGLALRLGVALAVVIAVRKAGVL